MKVKKLMAMAIVLSLLAAPISVGAAEEECFGAELTAESSETTESDSSDDSDFLSKNETSEDVETLSETEDVTQPEESNENSESIQQEDSEESSETEEDSDSSEEMTEPEHTEEPSEIISEESDKESDEEQEAVITIEKTDESEPSEPEENGEKGDTEEFVLPAIVSEEEAQENGYVARDKDSEENLYTFVFRNSDGTGTMRLYSHPVKYIDSEGETRDITLDVKEDGNGGYVSADHYVITQFPHDFTEGIELGYEDTDLHITAEITGENVFAEKTGGSVTYSADENTDYVYTLTYEGIKEDIVVSEYTGQTDYSFILDTAGLAVSENDGSYYLMDDKNEVKAAIGDIIVYSADDSNNTTGEIICDEITPNEQYRITLHVDDEYLSDEATVYPIRIDPTINVNYTNNGDGGIRDVTVYSNNTFNGTGSDLYVGRKNGLKARTLMKFPGLSLTNIHSSLNVTSATVEMIDCRHQEESVRVYCYMYGGSTWSENSASWNSTSEDYRLLQLDSVIVHNTTTHKFNFDISGAVKCWVDNSVSKDLGILFKASDTVESGTNDKFKEFASYNRFTVKPSLKVVFSYGIVRNQFYSKYDPNKYNDDEYLPSGIPTYSYLIKYRMNCYGYVMGFITNESGSYNTLYDIHGYCQQPGEFASLNNKTNVSENFANNNPSVALLQIKQNMEYDAERIGYSIQEYVPTGWQIPQYGENSRMIASVIESDGIGFHFYMQHNDGTWSHKMGNEFVSNLALGEGDSGNQIVYSDIILTNYNIQSSALQGRYSGGSIKFYIISKTHVIDCPHEEHSYITAPFSDNALLFYYNEIAGDYLETSRNLPVTGFSRADFLKDDDVYCFEQAIGKNYTVSAGNLIISVYNNDGVEINPVSGYTNKYYLNGGNRYYISISAIQKPPQVYSFNIS